MSVKILLRFIYENEKKFDIASLEEALPKSHLSIGGTTFINYNPANPVYGRRVWP
jgi:hypothetical protein